MDRRSFLGAGLAGVGVALGAFGAHALKDRLTADMLAIYETAPLASLDEAFFEEAG